MLFAATRSGYQLTFCIGWALGERERSAIAADLVKVAWLFQFCWGGCWAVPSGGHGLGDHRPGERGSDHKRERGGEVGADHVPGG